MTEYIRTGLSTGMKIDDFNSAFVLFFSWAIWNETALQNQNAVE
jgi:methylmalonyl-CoA mutase N-terminal domain/subunit